MQSVLEQAPAARPYSHKPILDSYDSGEECSFYHWTQVCKLVDDAEIFSADEKAMYSKDFVKAMEETMSEVEPATAYQHFAGNVV